MSRKLLGSLSFVSRTFEGKFRQNPYVLDMDANLYIGPADGVTRDEHSAIEVIFHFLSQTDRLSGSFGALLRNRTLLLKAFAAFDDARQHNPAEEFRIYVYGTYDGEPLSGESDDELPAGPCGVSINEVKLRFYRLSTRLDQEFNERELDVDALDAEARVLGSVHAPLFGFPGRPR